MNTLYICFECPRECGANRSDAPSGFCRSPESAVVCRAAPHFGEEPCISGTRGSGAIFFAGCNLRCVFCQNREISRGSQVGKAVTPERLREIITELCDSGVHNINLVTPNHYSNAILRVLNGFDPGIPLVWNSSAYEKAETLRRFEGRIDIYLPDMKYSDPVLAGRYSMAPDYPEKSKAAISEMFRQVGPCRFDENGLMTRGVIVRHLMLPGALDNTLGVIDWFSGAFPRGSVMFSLMSQYTPPPESLDNFPELGRTVSALEYDAAVSYLKLCGLELGYTQELGSATEELLPDFDCTGL